MHRSGKGKEAMRILLSPRYWMSIGVMCLSVASATGSPGLRPFGPYRAEQPVGFFLPVAADNDELAPDSPMGCLPGQILCHCIDLVIMATHGQGGLRQLLLERMASHSRQLRRDRELSFYGSEDLTPGEFYRRDDAVTALEMAREVIEAVGIAFSR
jgi:hypothetical protein